MGVKGLVKSETVKNIFVFIYCVLVSQVECECEARDCLRGNTGERRKILNRLSSFIIGTLEQAFARSVQSNREMIIMVIYQIKQTFAEICQENSINNSKNHFLNL